MVPGELRLSRLFIVSHGHYSKVAKTYFATVVEAVPTAAVVLAEDGCIFLANTWAEDLFGYGRGELLRQPAEILGPGILSADFLLSAAKQATEYRCELAGRRKNGTEIPLEITAHVREFENRKWILAAFRDISERKQAEALLRALEKSEEKFAKAFRHSPIGLTLTSVITQRFLDVNQTFERYTGYSREEMIGRTPFDLGLWVDPSERTEMLRQVLTQGPVHNVERRFRTRQGKVMVGLCSAELIETNDEQLMLTSVVDITECQRAVQELRESEEKFRTVFHDAPAGMAIVSLDGRYLAVNKAFCDFLGYTEEELLSKDAVTFTHPEDRAATLLRFKTLGDLSQAQRITKRYLHKNGQVLWALKNRSLIRDSQGKPAYLVSQVVDITERKRVEAELCQRERELKEAQRVAQIGSWTADETGKLTWSDEMYRIHDRDPGLPPPAFSELARFFTAESWAQLQAGRKVCEETGEALSLDLEWIRRDGSKRWIAARAEGERDANGRVVRFRGTAQDITERKLTENALRETEARFRTIANTAPVIIWMTGPDGRRTYINQPWLDLTGRPLKDELGADWVATVHPDDMDQCIRTFDSSFERRTPFKMEYRVRRHDGKYRLIVDVGVPRFELDDTFAGYIGSCVDETDRRAGEQALRTVSGRLIEAQEKERKRIARELHDDINQRLALLSIQLQRLQNTPHISAAELRKRLGELFKQTSEISSGTQALSHRLHSANLDYLGLVPAIKSFCDELAEHQGVRIAFIHTDVPAPVSSQAALGLFRVVQEGLHNAIKHSGVRDFEVRLLGRPEEIELTIRDSGAGFAAEAAPHATGLGLISMRERIHLLEGTLEIKSQPKLGTELIVRIPARR